MAVVFIGGAELAACYWLDPLIYHRIMDPVIDKVSALWRLGSDQVLLAVDNVKACIEEYNVTRQEKMCIRDSKDTLQTQYEGLDRVDLADALTTFAYAQYSYNAALRVGNDILSQSFIDYMS